LTIVPLRLYFKSGRAKLEIGLARGRKLHDKRSALRERETRREMDRALRDRDRA
jgi:SsrA-binding protein